MRSFLLSVVLLPAVSLLPATAAAVSPRAVEAEVTPLVPDAAELYRWFHQYPELSGQELKTAARVAKELRALGMEVHEGIGGTGVVGIMRSKKKPRGKVVLVRADMDGLPILEATGVAYRSRNEGVMHACGHDLHMSNAIGAMRVLKNLDTEWRGTILYISQPAEETGQGARGMLADKRFDKILAKVGKPDLAVAIHDASDLPAGDVSLVEGYASANVDSLDITVHGRGGHGAKPSKAIDPVVIAADIVTSLQSIVARRVRPGEKAVITVGKIHGGTKHNIIPAEVTMGLTVRSFGDDMRTLLLDEIRRVAVNVARAHGAPKDTEVVVRDEFTPSIYNDPAWTRRLHDLFTGVLGDEHVHMDSPGTGGEDFGRFGKQLGIPSVMYRLGASPRKLIDELGAGGVPQLHSNDYLPDAPAALTTGMTTLSLAILAGLGT